MPLLKNLDTNSASTEDWLRVSQHMTITTYDPKSITVGNGLFTRDDSDMAINALFECGPNADRPTTADLKGRGVKIRF
jgi:hypothetical protein